MLNRVLNLLATLAVFGVGAALSAQEVAKPTKTAAPPAAGKPAEGKLVVDEKSYLFTHALAYATTIDDEEITAVVLSGQAVSSEQLKEEMEEEKQDGGGRFKRPYLKLEFNKAGELAYWSAAAGNTSLGRARGKAKGELKREGGRVSGTASQPSDKRAFGSGFDIRFDVALVGAGESPPAKSTTKPGPAANVKPTVAGDFKGNGKEAKLAHVSAHWREPFGDEPSFVLVFTEKDHSKDKKPDFKASFGDFGSAIIISLHEGGDIFGCQVVHSAHEKQGFSSIGNIKTNNFKFADGKVEGELATDGQVETFGETWEVKIKFVVPLGEIPAEFQPAESKNPTESAPDQPAPKKPAIRPTDKPTAAKPEPKPEPQPAADQLNVKDLALTKDAADFEYKKLVEHLDFKSKSDVKSVCAELTANLKAQGWTPSVSDPYLLGRNRTI
ncbi:MAG: hypothetical protein ACR2FY_16540 [Pirellulaceae bacterium]